MNGIKKLKESKHWSSDSKNILITGDTEKVGIEVLIKLLGYGYHIKTLDNYIINYDDKNTLDYRGMGFKYNPSVVLKEGSPHNREELEESVKELPISLVGYWLESQYTSLCGTIIYFAPSLTDFSGLENVDQLLNLLEMAKEFGIRRFFYIAQDDNRNISVSNDNDLSKGHNYSYKDNEINQVFKRVASDDFIGIIIYPSEQKKGFGAHCSCIGINVISDYSIYQGNLLNRHWKQEEGLGHHLYFLPNSIAFLCGYTLKAIIHDLNTPMVNIRYLFHSIFKFTVFRKNVDFGSKSDREQSHNPIFRKLQKAK